MDELKQFARKSGKSFNRGPGKCYWADEFALRTISDWLQMTILIIDDEAIRGSNGKVGGRKRKLDDTDHHQKLIIDSFILGIIHVP